MEYPDIQFWKGEPIDTMGAPALRSALRECARRLERSEWELKCATGGKLRNEKTTGQANNLRGSSHMRFQVAA